MILTSIWPLRISAIRTRRSRRPTPPRGRGRPAPSTSGGPARLRGAVLERVLAHRPVEMCGLEELQPSRIGFGLICGAPRPAGRIAKFRCGPASPWIRPSRGSCPRGPSSPLRAGGAPSSSRRSGAGRTASRALVPEPLERPLEGSKDIGGAPSALGTLKPLAKVLGVDGLRAESVAFLSSPLPAL